jgi:ribonucleoside-diphosphate reductase beta chain
MKRFEQEWTQAYQLAINSDSDYHENGSGWTYPIRFIATSESTQKAVWLDLRNGTCLEACSGAEALSRKTEFEIQASERIWDIILSENADPLVALMTGKLKLTKGGFFTLSRYTRAAKDLVRLAADLEASTSKNQSTQKKYKANESVKSDEIVTLRRRINTNSFPYRLYEKAKVLGIWNPTLIDFTQDKKDWSHCSNEEKELLLHLTSLFQAGEESVTNEIVPLLLAVSREKRLEEELFLTTFLFEEAKHTDFFNRFLSEIAQTEAGDLNRFKGPNYTQLFDIELNSVMRRLLEDASPKNQLLASVTYNMVVEGSLAETGYHAYFSMLEKNNLMPGVREGISNLKTDESRHIAYGIYLISRILIEHPELKPDFDARMSYCLELVIGVIHEIFERYQVMPFGLQANDFIDFATEQFQRRYERIEKSLEKKEPFIEKE